MLWRSIEELPEVDTGAPLELGDDELPDAVKSYFPEPTGPWIADPYQEPVQSPLVSEPNFPPPAREMSEARLEELRGRYQAQITLSRTTGLATLLAGNFAQFQKEVGIEEPEATALAFLGQYGAALVGHDEELDLRAEWHVAWQDAWEGTRHLRYRQLGQKATPVWGAFVTFTFDSAGSFVLVSSSLYPLPVDAQPALPDEPATEEAVWEAIAAELPLARDARAAADAAPGKAKALPELRVEVTNLHVDPEPVFFPFIPGAGLAPDGWTLTVYGWRMEQQGEAQGAQGEYRVAYVVHFYDQFGFPWRAFVDLRPEQAPRLLQARPVAAHAQVPYPVLRSAADAQAIFDLQQAQLSSATLNQLAARVAQMTRPVELGDSAQTLRTATSVHFDGPRLYDPQDPAEGVAMGPETPEHFLGANLMFHLNQGHFLWENWLDTAAIAGNPSPPSIRNPQTAITVHLNGDIGRPWYDPLTGHLHFTAGVPGGQPAIYEPAFDGEVLAHEYAHAVMRHFCAQLFAETSEDAVNVAMDALNEGLAFFWACAIFNNAVWAEFAYAAWQAKRDLMQAPLRFSAIDMFGDDAGKPYAIGMWWARLLWELRRTLGGATFYLLLLRTLDELAALTPASDVAAADGDQTRACFVTLGRALLANVVEPARSHVLALLQQAELA